MKTKRSEGANSLTQRFVEEQVENCKETGKRRTLAQHLLVEFIFDRNCPVGANLQALRVLVETVAQDALLAVLGGATQDAIRNDSLAHFQSEFRKILSCLSSRASHPKYAE